jgi:hypothetical protein
LANWPIGRRSYCDSLPEVYLDLNQTSLYLEVASSDQNQQKLNRGYLGLSRNLHLVLVFLVRSRLKLLQVRDFLVQRSLKAIICLERRNKKKKARADSLALQNQLKRVLEQVFSVHQSLHHLEVFLDLKHQNPQMFLEHQQSLRITLAVDFLAQNRLSRNQEKGSLALPLNNRRAALEVVQEAVACLDLPRQIRILEVSLEAQIMDQIVAEDSLAAPTTTTTLVEMYSAPVVALADLAQNPIQKNQNKIHSEVALAPETARLP